MRVEVYKNLHTGTWSVRQCSTGLVIDHPTSAIISGAEFVVQPSGRDRVLRERVKNVHAFVRGVITQEATPQDSLLLLEEITYNPYKMSSFMVKSNEQKIVHSDYVVLNEIGVFTAMIRGSK